MSLPETLALIGIGLVVVGAAGIYAVLRWLRRVDDRGVWTAAELGRLHTPTRGRHRLAGQRAAEQIGRPGWTPRHDEDEIPPNIRSVTMGLPVVDRARCLAWTLAPNRRPAPHRDRRMRRVQLQLARRLRKSGTPTAWPTVGAA